LLKGYRVGADLLPKPTSIERFPGETEAYKNMTQEDLDLLPGVNRNFYNTNLVKSSIPTAVDENLSTEIELDTPSINVKDMIEETQTGSEILKENVPTSNWEHLVAQEKFEDVPKYDEDFLTGKFDSFVEGVEGRVKLATDEAFMTDVDLGMQLQPPVNPEDAAFLKIYNEDPDKAYEYWKNNISTWGTRQKEQMEHAEEIGADVDYGIKTEIAETKLNAEQLRIQELEKLLADKKEESPEIDAKAMVAENKALFADLLGVDKARGADITDMLLGFAGAEGDTTMEKFQAFAREEARRPGRRQKLEDAAGTLAIQDYIAGKRSKEQVSLMKERETFKLDEQIKRLYPQADDEWLSAVRKSAGKDDSYSSSKVIKKALAGKFEETPINPDQTKKDLAEINKDQEDFKIGFTIVTLKDGTKVIIEKTATDIKIRTDLPVF